MPSVQSQVAFIIGVDMHKHSHTASVVDSTGGEHAHVTVPTDAFGYRRLLRFAREQAAAPGCGRSKAPAASVAV